MPAGAFIEYPMIMLKTPLRTVFLLALFCLLQLALKAQKDDTIYLKNGDRLTGELKKFSGGIFTLSTEGLGKLSIEYDKVGTVWSKKYFEVVKKTGFSYYGSVVKATAPGSIGVVISNDTVIEPLQDIVEITLIRNRFWKKFYGSVDLGVSYYKSTSTFQYSLNSEINYRARKDLISFMLNMMFSEQETEDTLLITRKNDISLDYSHFFQGRWWGGFGGKYQKNTELDLDYRVQIGLGAGYDIVHTNPVRLYIMAGLLLNREKPTDSVSFSNNAEGLVSMKFTWLQHRHPKINISTDISLFPSLTISQRLRLEYSLSVKYEIFRDFFLGVSFYDDYDSKPAGGGTALNDWSAVFTIGYTF